VTEEEKAEKVSQTLAVLARLEEAFAKCSNGKDFFGESAAVKEVVPNVDQAVEHANKIRAYSAAAK
jgi:hypothetical protein